MATIGVGVYDATSDANSKKRDSNVTGERRRRESSRNGDVADDMINRFRGLRRTRRFRVPDNAHDTPRLSLGKDQFPLREVLG